MAFFFHKKLNLNRQLKWTFFSLLCGVLSGLAATVFLVLLQWATEFREHNLTIIWLLQVAGFLIGWVYYHFAGRATGGNNLILDEIHEPKNVLPLRMAPLVLLGTVATHLFGGSAGREGTAVQMGASLSDQLSHFFKIAPEERKILLAAGAGAGFSAAIGAPWAGVVFGMEVIHVGRLRLFAWFECLVASFAGYATTLALGAPHSHYPRFQIPDYGLKLFFFVALAGILFGLAARGFIALTHFIEGLHARWVSYLPLRPVLAGLVLVGLYYVEGTYRFAGLGIFEIQKARSSKPSLQERTSPTNRP